MNTIAQDLEIWLICNTPWLVKIISKSFRSITLHNIYSQLKISPYISNGEALEMHMLLQPFPELESQIAHVRCWYLNCHHTHLVGWKSYCLIFTGFQDSAQLVHIIILWLVRMSSFKGCELFTKKTNNLVYATWL